MDLRFRLNCTGLNRQKTIKNVPKTENFGASIMKKPIVVDSNVLQYCEYKNQEDYSNDYLHNK